MTANNVYKYIGLLLPVVLLATTWTVFALLKKHFELRTAYLLGFLFYWIVWCLVVPLLFLKLQEIRLLFAVNSGLFAKTKVVNVVCLTIPLLLGYGYAFPRALQVATLPILLLSFLLALVNAPLEELLWRGLYLKLFGSEKWLYIFYASLGFAIWHLAPQLIFPNKAPGGQVSFIVVAFIVGILFSIVSFHTRAILLTSLCHILFDFSGLGGRIYLH